LKFLFIRILKICDHFHKKKLNSITVYIDDDDDDDDNREYFVSTKSAFLYDFSRIM